MYYRFKWIVILVLAIWIGYKRQLVSKLSRTRSDGLPYIISTPLNNTDQYLLYNRTEQNKNGYFEFKYIVYSQGLCGNLQIPPMKRSCTPFLHIHPYQEERMTLLQGHLTYQLGDKISSCDIHTCPSPIIIPKLIPHTFWMYDNKEDLIISVHVKPVFKNYGLRAEIFENIIGVRRDKHMSIWQVFVFIDSIQTFPTFLPIFILQTIAKTGSLIGQLLGYQSEYEEYTKRA